MPTEEQILILGRQRAYVSECVQNKLAEIKELHKDILEELNIDFDKTIILAHSPQMIWFAENPDFPSHKLPSYILSQVNETIASCLSKYSETN